MRASEAPARSTTPRPSDGFRAVLGYLAAVIAATVGGTAGLGIASLGDTASNTTRDDVSTVAAFLLLYSAIVLGVLGPVAHWMLRRLRRQSHGAYALAGALLGGGVTAVSGGRALPPDMFVLSGTLAGLCAGLAFALVHREPKGAA